MTKVKGTLVLNSGASLKGEFWDDRWSENIWFESNGVVYPPVFLRRRAKPLDLQTIMRLAYAEIKIIDLFPSRNPFLELVHKGREQQFYPVPLIWGDDEIT